MPLASHIRSDSAMDEAAPESTNSPNASRTILFATILACLSAGIVSTAVVIKPIPPSSEDLEREARGKKRDLALAKCAGEIQQVADEYVVESLLLDAPLIEQFALKQLLGDRGIRFVELRADRIGVQNSERKAWGVLAVSGIQGSRIELNPDSRYVRFDLAKIEDPLCTKSYGFGIGGTGPEAPFAPDTCIRATPGNKSFASHAIRAIPASDGTGLIRWSLVEQSSDKVLVALTSSDAPDSPVQQPANGGKSAKFGLVSCNQPYFTLINALNGVAQQGRQSLSLTRRRIEPKLADLSSDAIAWAEIRVDEIEVPEAGKTGAERTSPWGKDWERAYDKAERTGFADVGEELIDFKSGELLSLGALKYEEKWIQPTYVGASSNGFAFVFGRPDGLRLVRFGFDGELKWQGKIQVNGRDSSVPAWPEIMNVKWAENELRIYVFRRNGQNVSHWLMRVPNSVIGVGKS